MTGLLGSTLPTATASGWSSADGKAQLFDGRSGEPYPFPVAVGYMYILKLPTWWTTRSTHVPRARTR